MFVVVSSLFLGGFGAVPFLFFFDFKTPRNISKTTQKPRRDDNKQLKYDITVIFFNIHF